MRKPSTKKSAPAKPPARSINIRLDPGEEATVHADIAHMEASGAIAPSIGLYCKHGALSYPRLRRIECAVRSAMMDPDAPEVVRTVARLMLEGAS